MTTKEYLKSIKYLDNEINAKLTELSELRKQAQCLSGVVYSSDKVQGGTTDSMQIVGRIVGLEKEIDEEIDRLVDLKADARKKIARVYNPKFIALLTDKYINGFTLEEIAERINKSYETVKIWHGQALQIFRKENNMK